MISGALFLWFKVFLPMSYFAVASGIAAIVVIQAITEKKSTSMLLIVVLVVLFTRNVYYFTTNFQTIPFWDGNWDYAAVKTFMAEERIAVLPSANPPAGILEWYSGWPALHSLVISLSQISGITPFHVFLGLPSLLSTLSLLVVFLMLEKIRKSLGLNCVVTDLALVVFAASADSVFWLMFLVRQSLALVFFFATICMLYFSIASVADRRKFRALAIFFGMVLVITHVYTSLVLALFFLIFLLIFTLGKNLIKGKSITSLELHSPKLSTLGIGLLISVFVFFWFNQYGTVAWPFIDSALVRFREILVGIRAFEWMPVPAYYPSALTPPTATVLLFLRDVFIYAPAVLGLVLLWVFKIKKTDRPFVIYSALAMGVLFVVDISLFRVEAFRLVTLALPFLSFSTAFSMVHLTRKLKPVSRHLTLGAFLAIPMLALFVGLWGHAFAPLHLYDPSINPVEVGERNTDFLRVSDFFEKRISTSQFQIIWVDDDPVLVFLLQPEDYRKISRLTPQYLQAHGSMITYQPEIVCEFKDFNLYNYYSREFSPIQTLEEATTLRSQLYDSVDRQLRIYDDGRYRFWVSAGQ
jgi:hypothetical protein